jgi:hypothetical protein
MMNNASCSKDSPNNRRVGGQIDAALHSARLSLCVCVCVCVCKFQALLLISASERSEFGGPPAEHDNAAVMRVLLIEMYGTRLTALR